MCPESGTFSCIRDYIQSHHLFFYDEIASSKIIKILLNRKPEDSDRKEDGAEQQLQPKERTRGRQNSVEQ